MSNEDISKLLPVVGTVVSIVGGLALNAINARRQRLKHRQNESDAQAFVNQFAITAQEKMDALENRVKTLESEGLEKDRKIERLQNRLDELESKHEKEINLDTDMG